MVWGRYGNVSCDPTLLSLVLHCWHLQLLNQPPHVPLPFHAFANHLCVLISPNPTTSSSAFIKPACIILCSRWPYMHHLLLSSTLTTSSDLADPAASSLIDLVCIISTIIHHRWPLLQLLLPSPTITGAPDPFVKPQQSVLVSRALFFALFSSVLDCACSVLVEDALVFSTSCWCSVAASSALLSDLPVIFMLSTIYICDLLMK